MRRNRPVYEDDLIGCLFPIAFLAVIATGLLYFGTLIFGQQP